MAARKKPASRGFVNNIILESLISGDKYGYEIIKEVEEKSNGKIILKQPSLYSSLKRFETKGYITSYWGDSDIGGRRHYYTITEVGKKYYYKSVNKDYDIDDDTQELEDENTSEQITFEEELKPESVNVVTDVNDKDYNIFDILEQKETSKPTVNTQIPQPKVVEKENAIQIEMFETNNTNNQSKILAEEKINVENIQQLKMIETSTSPTPQTEETEKQEIPLIKEPSHDFFSWEDLKRKQLDAKQNEIVKDQNEEPIKNQIVMDEFGIMKVGSNEEKKKEQKIFDNVGARINYNDPVIKNKTENAKPEVELTDEEREIKNQRFNEKLDALINSKPQKEEQPEIDYKNILGDLLATESTTEISEPQTFETYSYNDEISTNEEEIADDVIEEAVYQAEAYNQNIVQQPKTFDDGFKFKPYVVDNQETKNNADFILSNKAKLKYGIYMFVIMILQISTLLIILNSQNLLYSSDYLFYGLAYGLAAVILAYCIVTYLLMPDKRKANTFKLNYSLIFGLILCVSTCALTYALNTFAGLNSSNVSLFTTTIWLPIILSTNFILTPLIYRVILLDKKNY